MCLDLFFHYADNNLFQHQVAAMCSAMLSVSDTPHPLLAHLLVDCALPQRIVHWWGVGCGRTRRGYMGHLTAIAGLLAPLDLAVVPGMDSDTVQAWRGFVDNELAEQQALSASEIGGPKPPKPAPCSDNESDDEGGGVHMMFSKYCERMTAEGRNFDDDENEEDFFWVNAGKAEAEEPLAAAEGASLRDDPESLLDGGWAHESVGELDDSFGEQMETTSTGSVDSDKIDEAEKARWQGDEDGSEGGTTDLSFNSSLLRSGPVLLSENPPVSETHDVSSSLSPLSLTAPPQRDLFGLNPASPRSPISAESPTSRYFASPSGCKTASQDLMPSGLLGYSEEDNSVSSA